MKHSIRGSIVVLAIVVSFVFAQGVCARDLNDFPVETYIGVVKSVDVSTRAIVLESHPGLTFDQMGPSWYWDEKEIPYPVKGDEIEIQAFFADCLSVYVGVSVNYIDPSSNGFIQLRDDELKPLWNPNVKTTNLSGTAAEVTGDGEPIIQQLQDGYMYEYKKEYNNAYENNYYGPGPHNE